MTNDFQACIVLKLDMKQGVVIEVDFKKLRRHAKANRWSSPKIAAKIGVSKSSVWSVLVGRTPDPGATTLKKICDVIGLPIEDAFTTPRRKVA